MSGQMQMWYSAFLITRPLHHHASQQVNATTIIRHSLIFLSFYSIIIFFFLHVHQNQSHRAVKKIKMHHSIDLPLSVISIPTRSHAYVDHIHTYREREREEYMNSWRRPTPLSFFFCAFYQVECSSPRRTSPILFRFLLLSLNSNSLSPTPLFLFYQSMGAFV